MLIFIILWYSIIILINSMKKTKNKLELTLTKTIRGHTENKSNKKILKISP